MKPTAFRYVGVLLTLALMAQPRPTHADRSRFDLNPGELPAMPVPAATTAVPSPAPKPSPQQSRHTTGSGTVRYTVKPGDHIFRILMHGFGLSNQQAELIIPEVMKLNNISNIRALRVGQELVIPLAPSPPRHRRTAARENLSPPPATASPATQSAPLPALPAAPAAGQPAPHVTDSPETDAGAVVPVPLSRPEEAPPSTPSPLQPLMIITEESAAVAPAVDSEPAERVIPPPPEAAATPPAVLPPAVRQEPAPPALPATPLANRSAEPPSAPVSAPSLLSAPTPIPPQMARIVSLSATDRTAAIDRLLDLLAPGWSRSRIIERGTEPPDGMNVSMKVDRYAEVAGRRYIVTSAGDPLTVTLLRLLEDSGYRVLIITPAEPVSDIAGRLATLMGLPCQTGHFRVKCLVPSGAETTVAGVRIAPASPFGTQMLVTAEQPADCAAELFPEPGPPQASH